MPPGSDGAAVARRRRGFVAVSGPEAAEYLERMVSNHVLGLQPGESREALLLTPKGRIIAPLVVLRRDADFLLLTEPELAEVVRDHLLRARFAAKVVVEVEEHTSHLLLGVDRPPAQGGIAIPTDDYGVPGYEVLDARAPAGAGTLNAEQLERMRIEAGTPRFGTDIDERVLPAEAGLVERAVSFTKGCFPGQEPIARLHYRGHANRRLAVLQIDGERVPAAGTAIVVDGKPVGRVTSAVRADGVVVALGYVRTEVPAEAELAVAGAPARLAASAS